MKFICVLVLVGFCALTVTTSIEARYNNPAVVSTPTSTNTLTQDLDEIMRLIPTKDIQRLVMRYLLNDAQFQAFVRIINSRDAYITYMHFRAQPEVRSFITWVRGQIMLSGGELQSDESNESLQIFNRAPFWSQNVNGWEGFVNEFHLLYPEEAIRMQVQKKAAESSVFGEFLQREMNQKPAYDRVMVMPEAKRMIAALKANGVETDRLDDFIRTQFGFQHASDNATDGPQQMANKLMGMYY